MTPLDWAVLSVYAILAFAALVTVCHFGYRQCLPEFEYRWRAERHRNISFQDGDGI